MSEFLWTKFELENKNVLRIFAYIFLKDFQSSLQLEKIQLYVTRNWFLLPLQGHSVVVFLKIYNNALYEEYDTYFSKFHDFLDNYHHIYHIYNQR
jgi:hypothetical protein